MTRPGASSIAWYQSISPARSRRLTSRDANTTKPAVSVIVPARDAAATIGETLAALAAQDLDQPYEVVVVDDASADATAAIAERAGDVVSVVRIAGPAGPGRARNAGVARTASPLLAFTDADCVPAPGWLREGLAALGAADLVQGAVRPDPRVVPRPFDRTISVGREYGLYETASLFVRRPLYERLGGFDDWLAARIGKPLGEDVWFGWRARRAGARIAFAERAVVEHAVFRRGPAEYLAERVRVAYFPALAARIPELRGAFFYRRWFLNRRTAAFDAALVGAAAAAIVTRAPSSAALPALAAAIPYASIAARSALAWGRRDAPRVAAVELAADVVGFVALIAGSVRWRAPVM